MTIPGGYILQPRCIDDSDIMKEPPVVRELWMYLLRRVNYKDNGKYPRGTAFFNLGQIQDSLCWYQGWRKRYYSKPQLQKSLCKLNERNMIATQKATRGIYVTILNYDYYQDPGNYEGNDERTPKEQRKKQNGIAKNKKGKKEEEEYSPSYEGEPTTSSDEVVLSSPSSNGSAPLQKIAKLWNDTLDEHNSALPRLKKIQQNTQRHKHIRARWKEYPDLETWEVVFQKIAQSDFLNGRIKKWQASFDWVIGSPDKFLSTLEGKYDNRNPPGHDPKEPIT